MGRYILYGMWRVLIINTFSNPFIFRIVEYCYWRDEELLQRCQIGKFQNSRQNRSASTGDIDDFPQTVMADGCYFRLNRKRPCNSRTGVSILKILSPPIFVFSGGKSIRSPPSNSSTTTRAWRAWIFATCCSNRDKPNMSTVPWKKCSLFGPRGKSSQLSIQPGLWRT